MIKDLITDETYLDDVVCETWEELVDIGGPACGTGGGGAAVPAVD